MVSRIWKLTRLLESWLTPTGDRLSAALAGFQKTSSKHWSAASGCATSRQANSTLFWPDMTSGAGATSSTLPTDGLG